MIEVWKDIAGFEGLYQVSTLGNVKSLGRMRLSKNESFSKVKERILKPALRKGYLKVVLCKDGKRNDYDIQQLVANAFISNPNGYPCVHHKNENKQDNRVENLEWVSHQKNIEYSCAKPVYCVELNKMFKSIIEAKRITGINDRHICSCCKGRRNTAGGYHWRYA